MKKAQVLELLHKAQLYPDRLTESRNDMIQGSFFTYKRSYFYRAGQSAEQIAADIRKAIPGVIIIKAEDQYKAWPKTSYFVVTFKA